jgi:hypothetical protein
MEDMGMKVTIESTEKIVILKKDGAEVPARIWEGATESGIPVHCYITRIAVSEGREPKDYEQFERELQEQRKPSMEIQAIPLRLIL